jgi:hypothetical protein
MNYRNSIQKKDKRIGLDTLRIGDTELLVTGKIYRKVRVKGEWDKDIHNPEVLIHELKSKNIRADVFIFMQRLPHTKPAFHYRMEEDNIAAIPISTYEQWWTNQVNRRVRLKVRKSQRAGVVVRLADFNDELIRGITDIYNESPVRQGQAFWHYGMSFEETKQANSTYLDRTDFIGAYLGDELIGFIKLVYTDNYARAMGILGKIAHRDKAPVNALLAKAVEICVQKGIPYLTYGKMIYGSKGIDSLADFKRYNGFQEYKLPRYYVPLSAKGKVILALNLHKDIRDILPGWLVRTLLKMRRKLFEKKYGSRRDSEKHIQDDDA